MSNYPCILLYHEIDPISRPLLNHYYINLNPRVFETHARTIHRHFKPIGTEEMIAARRAGQDVRDRVMITFDDGYRAAIRNAAPVLADLGLDSIWFVNSAMWRNDKVFWLSQLMWLAEQGLIEHFIATARKRWPDIVPPLADMQQVNSWAKQSYSRKLELYLREFAALWGFDEEAAAQQSGIYASPGELAELAKTAQIGNHTASHPNMRNLSLDDFRGEVRSCHEAIEAEVGLTPTLFAFPFGEFGQHWSPHAPAVLHDLGYENVFSVETPQQVVSSGVWKNVLPRHPVPLGPATESEFKAYVQSLLDARCL
jgi:peptidoglycan/xylan/chitin deacetylase (PgdA/CDA1 family)